MFLLTGNPLRFIFHRFLISLSLHTLPSMMLKLPAGSQTLFNANVQLL